MRQVSDMDLTRLQETGSTLLPRREFSLAALLEAVEQLGIDPSLVTVQAAGAALWLRVRFLEDPSEGGLRPSL